MSREIKFRAWYEGEMHHDVSKMRDGLYWNKTGDFNIFAFKDLRNKLMQFTRLHDKNGTEIYEGDKLKRGDYIFTVLQESSGAWIARRNVVSGTVQFMVETIAFQCEVVGNIYQPTDTVEQS